MHVRVCPDCGEEYRPEIVSCADCGVELVDADDEIPRPAAEAGGEAEAGAADPEEAFVLQSSEDARDLTPLAEAVSGAGVPFRIVSRDLGANQPRHHLRYELVVPLHAAEAARHAVAAVAEQHPDLGLQPLPPPATEEEWEAEIEAVRSRSTCPACGAHFAAGSLECPGCGLTLGSEEEGGS